jgi:hypothetical protein
MALFKAVPHTRFKIKTAFKSVANKGSNLILGLPRVGGGGRADAGVRSRASDHDPGSKVPPAGPVCEETVVARGATAPMGDCVAGLVSSFSVSYLEEGLNASSVSTSSA